ncbi:MAG: hypothetical protein SW833_15725 [Cyanobacteriota bacterium]|nr:hypothetical protein [Cyanobacteriota bacterium]
MKSKCAIAEYSRISAGAFEPLQRGSMVFSGVWPQPIARLHQKLTESIAY